METKTREALEKEIIELNRRLQLLEEQAQIIRDWQFFRAVHRLQNIESFHHTTQPFDNLNLICFTIEKDGKITYCNLFTAQTFGYLPHELIGKDFFEMLIIPEEQSSRRNYHQKVFQKEAFWESATCRLKAKNGSLRWINFTSVILHDSEGEITALTKLGEDITEKQKVEQALKTTNEVLQDLFDNSHDIITICTAKGDFLFVNKAFKRKTGYTNEELAQLKVFDLIEPSVRKNTLDLIERIARGETLLKFETTIINRNQQKIYVEGNLSFKYNEEGKPAIIRAILYDVTDKLRAEKAQNLYYSIANLTVRSKNLNQLYQAIHQELAKVIDANNFYIKLYEPNREYIYFPYFVDEARESEGCVHRRKAGEDLTDYVVETQKAVFLYQKDILKLQKERNIRIFGPIPKIWMGVPLKVENEIIGIISVKSYKSEETYTYADLELLDFISGQIALAIQRKQNEEKLNNQTARLKSIFESGTHLMCSLNRRYQFTSFNQNYLDAIVAQFGIEPKLNVNMPDLAEAMRKAGVFDFWLDKYRLAFAGKPQHFEIRILTQAQEVRWQEVFLNPIRLADGTIEEVSAIAHDITEKKQAEIALKESEEKFRNIFESFQDIYYQADLQGNIQIISPSVYEIMGYYPKEVIGRNISEFAVEGNSLKNALKEILQKRKIKNLETDLITKQGNILSGISNIKLIVNEEGKPQAIEGVVRDITELKKATEEVLKAKELAEKSLKVKESFLANMSHEIRTPMNGVIGMIDLMMTTPLNEEQREYMLTIKKSSETLLNILNDILDLSKIEAGKMELHQKPIHFHQTIEKVHTLFLQQASLRGNTLSYYIHSDVPTYIIADETRLLQIIANLVSNAIKFTKNGKIDLQISLYKQEPPYLWLKVAVNDTGIGISEENMSKLFTTFRQLDNSFSKSYSGTGLGLSISKELCRLMNGEIHVESELGKGSTFWFTFQTQTTGSLPVYALQTEEEGTSFLQERFAVEHAPYILLVDDNQINQKVASQILLRIGCKVDLASSGFEAIEKVRNATYLYDVIFMDIQMPDMDGVQTTQKLRQLNLPHLPPIIAMTAYSMKEDKERFLAQGLDDYIAKPIRAQNLVEKVKQILAHLPKEKVPPTELPKPVVTYQNTIQDKQNIQNQENQETQDKQDIQNNLINKDLPILQTEVLAQLEKYGGKELVLTSLEEFEQEATQILATCQEAIKKKDKATLLKELHTLKGNAGTLGVAQVAFWAKHIEQQLKNQETKLPKDQEWKNLLNAFQHFKENYKQSAEKN
ncbi:MAG: PAS domain S-box protein [Microscillaceae bacterium]|nr:PAS domain S-box protein [Microscillaceae bacterium]MDW8460203.1 PAS domain S-box protein [Cytophagales bacterium]